MLTDNGPAYRSIQFAQACRELGLKHHFTRPYTPRTNGKAERFIQTALREWADAYTYQDSTECSQQLRRWLHTPTTGIVPMPVSTNFPHQPPWPRSE